MGYACPVCGVEQADDIHLANHLAVTASLDRTDHREWLETHAPDWAACGPAELAERIVDDVPTVETPEFEGHSAGTSGGRTFEQALTAQGHRPGRGDPTTGVADVLAEARALTERMYETKTGSDEAAGEEGQAGGAGEEE